MTNFKEQELIKKCLLQIEERLAWGSSDNWHNDVFIELSETIQKQTDILLSPTTLKRVWGKVNYSSTPSINTLNTLAQCAGYINWRDFKNKSVQQPIKFGKVKNLIFRTKVLGFAAIAATLLAFLFLAMRANHDKNADFDFSKIEFSSRPIAKGIPNSVVFDIDLKGLVADRMHIQQYWDKTKTIQLKPKQTQATGQYYFPGYFRAKIVVDGNIKKEHDLFIKSDGWLGTIDFEPTPKYFDESSLIQHSLKLPEQAIEEIISSEKPLVSSFHYVDNLGDISGDNFLLETSFRNVYSDKWAVCSTTRIVVLGTKGALIIPFSIPGCVSEIGLMLNDVYKSGKEHDLSMFGTELSEFGHVEIRVEDKLVEVSIHEKQVYSGRYHETIGDIVGIRYRFLGAGEVAFLKLKDLSKDSIVMDEYFTLVSLK